MTYESPRMKPLPPSVVEKVDSRSALLYMTLEAGMANVQGTG